MEYPNRSFFGMLDMPTFFGKCFVGFSVTSLQFPAELPFGYVGRFPGAEPQERRVVASPVVRPFSGTSFNGCLAGFFEA